MTAPGDPGDAVELWLLEPARCAADDLASALAWLSDAERRRYHAFVFDRHRLEYLATRALIRRVLSSHHPVAPADWQFELNAYGRPAVDPRWGVRFNLANHPTLVVCAVRHGGELGVDVEPLDRGADVVELAASVFAPSELAALHALPAPARPDRALSLWTLKEAYIKARGMGLSLALDSFAFSFDAATGAIGFSPSPGDPARWQFRTLDLLGHRVALATEATEATEATGAPGAIGAPALRIHRVTAVGAAGLVRQPLAAP